jgi:hypothetical protein
MEQPKSSQWVGAAYMTLLVPYAPPERSEKQRYHYQQRQSHASHFKVYIP